MAPPDKDHKKLLRAVADATGWRWQMKRDGRVIFEATPSAGSAMEPEEIIEKLYRCFVREDE